MASGNCQKYIVNLTAEERAWLVGMLNQGSGPARQLQHAHVLLQSDRSELGPHWTDEQIAQSLHVGVSTVQRVRILYAEQGLMAALHRAQPSRWRAPKLGGNEEAHLISLACSPPPSGYARWTLRLLASKLVELEYVETISYESVRQTLKKTNLNLGLKSNGVYHPRLTESS